jgi:mersacidin/lichenicidin family type 2 lantibiotic
LQFSIESHILFIGKDKTNSSLIPPEKTFTQLNLRRNTMSNIDIARAWKDEEYRNSLTEEQRSQLPENPAGIIELADEEMESLTGAGKGNRDNTSGPKGCNTNRIPCIVTFVGSGVCNGPTQPIG